MPYCLSRAAVAVPCLVAALALAQAPKGPPQQAAEAPPAETEDLRAAPSSVGTNTPPEAELSPPPDSEKAQAPQGFVEILNPAFPAAQAPALAPAVVDRGRRYDAADVAPYFATGKLAEARTEFERGRFARARTLLAGAGSAPPVRYLRALSALRAEDFQAAATEMTALAADYPALSDRCAVHAAIALEELSRFKEAAALYAKVPQGSRLATDARLGLARTLRRSGDLDGAVAALQPLAAMGAPGWGRDVGAEVLISLADLARQRKDAAAEREALIAAWSLHPLSAIAKTAEARLKGVKLDAAAHVGRAEALIEAHRNKQGMDALEPWLPKLKLPDALACRAHFAYGKALRKQREHTRAIAVLAPVTEKCTSEDLRARALYVLGSSRSIVDVAHGPATYEALARDFPEHSFADDALFFAADLYVKNGNLDGALARLDQLSKAYPTGDFAAEALFKSFWIRRSRGQLEDALSVLDEIERIFRGADESYELERSLYWRARIYEGQGDKARAGELFGRLAVSHPATYYGLMARLRLPQVDAARAAALPAQLAVPRASKESWPLYVGTMGEDAHFLAGIELLRLGFSDAAASELLSVNRGGQPAEALRLLVQVLVAAGDSRSAHAIARVALRKSLSGQISAETRSVWESAYPNAFRDPIERHCKSADVDPDLLQALMREESALDPKALSWAGALGLTQLMPATAKAVARVLKLKGVSPRSLLEPDLNIRLGSWQLGSLLKKFKGNKIYAIASYNAGAGAVERWRSDRPSVELDEWVEEIPIAETRGYVKRVLRSFNTYQLLYQRKPPTNTVTSRR